VTEPDPTTQAPRVDVSTHGQLSKQFRDLFDAEFGFVCRALQRLGVRSGDVPDVAQELFLTVHRAMPEYDTARPIRPWLCGFSVRFAANYRRLGRLGDLPVDAAGHQSVAPPADLEARELVLKVLDRLDFDRRAVVVMHDMEGFAAPEIAAELGIPLNTVYSRLRLAREELKATLSQLQQEGGVS
jgi:RNA polymerase sigma-70 factor (ECF subfamily)